MRDREQDLYVEDDEPNFRLVGRMLATGGHVVGWARDVQDDPSLPRTRDARCAPCTGDGHPAQPSVTGAVELPRRQHAKPLRLFAGLDAGAAGAHLVPERGSAAKLTAAAWRAAVDEPILQTGLFR